jgi:hypothetical protein
MCALATSLTISRFTARSGRAAAEDDIEVPLAVVINVKVAEADPASFEFSS